MIETGRKGVPHEKNADSFIWKRIMEALLSAFSMVQI